MDQPTSVQIAEVCCLLMKGLARTDVRRETGVGRNTIEKVDKVLAAHGFTSSGGAGNATRKVISRSRGQKPRLDLQKMRELCRDFARDSRSIAVEMGCNDTSVIQHRKKFELEWAAQGIEIPKCVCGRQLRHSGLCPPLLRLRLLERGRRTSLTLSEEELREVERRFRAGDSMREIGAAVSMTGIQIDQYARRTFTPDSKAERLKAKELRRLATREAKKRASALRPLWPNATDPKKDALFAAIDQSVPRAIEPCLRDDITSQAYLEVLEGTIDRGALREGVKRVQSRVYANFAGRWGTISLDQPARVGDIALCEMIADPGPSPFELTEQRQSDRRKIS